MERTDAKRMSPEGQYELRKQIVRLRENGIGCSETSAILGVSAGHVSRTWSAYQKAGSKGISLRKRGNPVGSGRTLTPDQEKEIQRILIDKNPEQLKFPWALWTREAICALIKRQYKIDMPIRSISHYLKRWGFTCQRPAKRANKQDAAKEALFLAEEYPAIAARAKKENAEIYWGDETGIQNVENYQKGFSPKGQPPVLMIEAQKQKINMLAAINNYGKVRFMLFEDMMNGTKLIDFMKRLCKDAGRKVFLILDNLRAHHGKMVRAWLADNKERIEVFFLPPYSPEHNPAEYLNHDLKLNVHRGTVPNTKADLKHRTRSFMKKIQRRPLKVQAYFKHKAVRYAA